AWPRHARRSDSARLDEASASPDGAERQSAPPPAATAHRCRRTKESADATTHTSLRCPSRRRDRRRPRRLRLRLERRRLQRLARIAHHWASNQGTSLENDKEVLTPVLEKFTEESGIEVSLEVIGWADILTRIQTAINYG